MLTVDTDYPENWIQVEWKDAQASFFIAGQRKDLSTI